MRFDTALATLALAGAGVSAAPLDRRTAEALAAIFGSPSLYWSGPASVPQKRQFDLQGWAESDPFSELRNFGPSLMGEQKRHVAGPQDWPDTITIGNLPVGNVALAAAQKRALLEPPFNPFINPVVTEPLRDSHYIYNNKREAVFPGAGIFKDLPGTKPYFPLAPDWAQPQKREAHVAETDSSAPSLGYFPGYPGIGKLLSAAQKREAYPQFGRERVPPPKNGIELAVCGYYIGRC
ncbi:hypothetical protein CBER1_06605 [Cercospora berteroae]|uniref:Enterotoxin n=1 Tax=Cercospora berteroae TaxID=357750 RepID=A0A2S6BUG8_9PEZI|nr:hypothetical protein CBER1_06605 [Cercospora berteroae]